MTRPHTLQRLERILVMVPWLLDNPGVSVDEVAARFDVDRAELIEDLDVLGYCGLPGYGGGDLVEAQVYGDRITVRMADFFSRPLRLSVREAVTLRLAAQALAAVEGFGESEPLRRALTKLESVLGTDGSRVAVDLGAPGDELLPTLRRAVGDGRVVSLVYRSGKGETTERDVEPWAVVGDGGAWYLQGWCRLATAPRDFRLDRIQSLDVTDEELPGERGEPSAPAYEPAADDVVVELDVEPDAWWIADEIVVDDSEELSGGRRRLRLRTSSLEWAARLVLRLGGSATVVAPEALAERVAALADITLRGYADR